MSGPVLINISGDILGGPHVNHLVINGSDGDMALYIPGTLDSLVFGLFMGSKLNPKEKVFGIQPGARPKGPKVEDLVPVSDKVKP